MNAPPGSAKYVYHVGGKTRATGIGPEADKCSNKDTGWQGSGLWERDVENGT